MMDADNIRFARSDFSQADSKDDLFTLDPLIGR